MATAQAALDSARTYLNDQGQQIWTNTILLPFLVEAHKDLLLALLLNGIPVLREKSAAINVTAVTGVTLTLPTDLVEPISLKERPQTSTNITDYVRMEEKEFEPDTPQTDSLRYWCWREEAINFVGATTARTVLLRYWKSLTTITATTTTLGFLLAEVFLGPQTAAYAANSVGNTTLAQELAYVKGKEGSVAGSKLAQIIAINVKGMQNLPARRIPYRRYARSRFML